MYPNLFLINLPPTIPVFKYIRKCIFRDKNFKEKKVHFAI